MDTTKQRAPNNNFKINEPPNFQTQVANGQSEKPLALDTLNFDIGGKTFAAHLVSMKKQLGPIIVLHFLRKNSVVIDTTHDLIHFPHLTMQIKSTLEMSAKPQAVLTDDVLTIPPSTTKIVTAFVDHPSEWNTTSTVTPLEKTTETASLLISHSMSTTIDTKVAMRVTNTTETPYLIKRITQIAELSVVTPEQAKSIKPVEMTILSMVPKNDPDMTTYMTDILRTNELEKQSNIF